MKLLSILFLSIALIGCSTKKNTAYDFQKFSSKFQLISFPFVLNDHMAFRYWDQENLMDTNVVLQYDLTSKYADKENPIINCSNYKCSYVGKYEGTNYLVYMYKMLTSGAENSKPKIILATVTKDGKKVDEMIALWLETQSELQSQSNILNLVDNRKVEIKSIVTNYGYLNGQKVEKKKNLKVVQYEMDRNGKIIKLQEISNDVFKDDNPKILEKN